MTGHELSRGRRRVLVDRTLQLRLLSRVTLLALAMLAAVWFALLAPAIDALHAGDGDAAAADLYRAFRWLVAACVGVAMLGSIWLSHRIAGPLVRFRRHLDAVGAGQLPPPLRTRRGDLLADETLALNAMVDQLANRIGALRAVHAEMTMALLRSRKLLATSRDLEVRQAVAGAVAGAEELRALLGEFARVSEGEPSAPSRSRSLHASEPAAGVT